MAVLSFVRRRPLACYFALVYLLPGVALLVIGLPKLHSTASRSMLPVVMFPVMVIGVGLTGIALTAVTGGRKGLRELAARFRHPVAPQWLAVLLIPPVAILAVLGGLSLGVSSQFAPQFFIFGIAAGVVAGFCEEIGWTGFAYPRMRARLGWLPAAPLLGVLWGLWHLPVVDSLGAASPHGSSWPEFFAAFIAVLAAIRVLIAWTYTHWKPADGPAAARLLHRLPGDPQRPTGHPRPGGPLVRRRRACLSSRPWPSRSAAASRPAWPAPATTRTGWPPRSEPRCTAWCCCGSTPPASPGPAHSTRWPTRPWPASPFSTLRRTGTPPDRHPRENCHASHPCFP